MTKKVTLSGKEPELLNDEGAPGPIDPRTGMHTDYWVLSEEELKKGFVRPVRQSYEHVGIRPKYPLRELTEDERQRYDEYGYVRFETYPVDSPEARGGSCKGRFWTQENLDSGCGTVTTMNRTIAETYAREPRFYGSTFCCGCGLHLPVKEFNWKNTNEPVGS